MMKGTCGFELTLKGILVPDMQPTIGGLEVILRETYPELKVHGANMGPIWGWQDPGGPHVSPMNLAIWVLHAGTVLI